MPANLYGPNDNFHPTNSHVIPGMMRRFVETKERGDKEMVIWGTGKPTRDFLFSEDLAEGLVLLMNEYNDIGHINIGPGKETSIGEVAQLIKEIVGYEGELIFDTTKPDGTPRRYLATEKIKALGWEPKTSLRDGLQQMYEWFMENRASIVEK
jgi:GDP-L-fucose synthase